MVLMIFEGSSFLVWVVWLFVFFKKKTAYEMRISEWSSDVCSSDLPGMRQRAVSAVGIARDAPETRLMPEDAGEGRGDADRAAAVRTRSEERRAGHEGVSTCRSRWSPDR